MKRLLFLSAFLLLVGACTSRQEVAPVPTEPDVATTTAPTTASSTTTVPAVTTTESTTTLPPLQSMAYESVATFPYPVQIISVSGSEFVYIVSKDGTIWVMEDGVAGEVPVLDISTRVLDSGERGLLSAAIHPQDPLRLFAHYNGRGGETVVAEYELTDQRTGDPDSERILLQVSQPAGNHNGGMIQFWSDGALYVGLGDGGGSNDQFRNGQNTDSLLGGLVRLDVDTAEATLYNYGLRNPWRFWIDGPNIYIADVGQDTFEEVNAVSIQPGLNFGWSITEGLHCFSPSSGCDTSGITLPVVEVAHGDAGTCSITGGVVYRGSLIPEIAGQYFYSDYCGGYLRSFRFDGQEAADQVDWTDQVGVPGRVTGFGVDGDGEMYVTTESELLKVVAVR